MNLVVPRLRPIEQVDASYADDILRLFQGEWWCNKRSIADVHKVLKGSTLTFGIVDDHSGGLLAFSRVLTDFVFFGFIFDLIVDKDLRGKGVGTALLGQIIEHPRLAKLQSLELCCQPDKKTFYEGFGFVEAGGRMRLSRPGSDF